MGVPQYTTPTFALTFDNPDIDLTLASAVFVSFKSGAYYLRKTGDDLQIEPQKITVCLTQEETSHFGVGNDVAIQANWKIGDSRVSSNIILVDISEQLLKEVI